MAYKFVHRYNKATKNRMLSDNRWFSNESFIMVATQCIQVGMTTPGRSSLSPPATTTARSARSCKPLAFRLPAVIAADCGAAHLAGQQLIRRGQRKRGPCYYDPAHQREFSHGHVSRQAGHAADDEQCPGQRNPAGKFAIWEWTWAMTSGGAGRLLLVGKRTTPGGARRDESARCRIP